MKKSKKTNSRIWWGWYVDKKHEPIPEEDLHSVRNGEQMPKIDEQ